MSVRRVLLVEDDEDVREAVADALVHAGYEVVEAEHGRAALDLLVLQKPPYDIAVVDLVMPVMDGRTLLSELRREQPSLPVVILSGSRMVHEPIDGATVVVEKPVTTAALLAAIETALA